MKLRIWGTQEECAAMVAVIRANVPEYYIKSISGWYRNDRKIEKQIDRILTGTFYETIE